jgi:flagellar biosynthesis protein FlhF
MRLKSFYAKTMTEAMQMVRDSLGEDAIIIATREERGGKSVRVTAAIEEDHRIAFEIGKSGEVAAEDDWLQYDEENGDENNLSEAIIDVLLKHSVPEDVMDHIVSCASVMDIEEPSVAFVGAIDTLFNFTPLPTRAYKKALMFVGPPGAGKTLTVAKQAARAVMEGLNVAVITTDTMRAGGTEQLAAFTKVLEISLTKAKTPADLARALRDASDADQVIIDTNGFNPFDSAEMKDLAKLIVSGDIEPVLVMPAGLDATESGEMARIFAALGVHRLLPTRVDIARRLGGLLAAAHQGNLSFSDISATPQVADGLQALSPRRLGAYFFPATPTPPNKTRSTTRRKSG